MLRLSLGLGLGASPAVTGGGSAFSPLSLFSVGADGFLLDIMSSLSNATQISNGTGGAPAVSGDPIGRLVDLAAGANGKAARHVEQATAGNRLVLRSLGLRNAAAVELDDRWMASAAPNYTAAAGFTRISRVYVKTLPGGESYFGSDRNGAGSSVASLFNNGTTMQLREGGGPVSGTAPLPSVGAWHTFREIWSVGTNQWQLAINGVAAAAATLAGVTASGFELGKGNFLQAPDCGYGRILQINRVLSAGEISNVETWMAS